MMLKRSRNCTELTKEFTIFRDEIDLNDKFKLLRYNE